MSTFVTILLIAAAIYFYRKIRRWWSNANYANQDRPSWVRPFSLYYIASEMMRSPDNDLPANVIALTTGESNAHLEQSILVSLQRYLSHSYGRNREPNDYTLAVRDLTHVVATELRVVNSTSALKLFVRSVHKEETGENISEVEVDKQVADIISSVDSRKLVATLLNHNIMNWFNSSHGKTIHEYSREMCAQETAEI